MAKIENLAVHVLEQTLHNIQGSMASTLQAIEQHKTTIKLLENQLAEETKELNNIESAIKKISGEKDVKSTSKSKKA